MLLYTSNVLYDAKKHIILELKKNYNPVYLERGHIE